MSAGPDWIVIRKTGTHLDGTWVDRPFRWATRLTLGPGLAVVATPGFEQDDEKGVAQVWEPERRPVGNILFKVESTYGASPPCAEYAPSDEVQKSAQGEAKPTPPRTLLGKPIVEVGPDHFPPLKTGEIVMGRFEDIVPKLLDDLDEPEEDEP